MTGARSAFESSSKALCLCAAGRWRFLLLIWIAKLSLLSLGQSKHPISARLGALPVRADAKVHTVTGFPQTVAATVGGVDEKLRFVDQVAAGLFGVRLPGFFVCGEQIAGGLPSANGSKKLVS